MCKNRYCFDDTCKGECLIVNEKKPNKILLWGILLSCFLISGCHSAKWEWLPKDQKNFTNKHEHETGVLKTTIIKGSW